MNVKCGIAAMMALVAGLSACATSEKCGFAGCSNDAKITAAIDAQIRKRSDLQTPDSINVQTLDGVVYLTGSTSTGLQKRIAGSIAEETKGVKGVENEIYVDF